MRLGYSLGSLLSVKEVLECAKILSTRSVDSIWIPETWGMEGFSTMSAVSGIAKNVKIGSSIVNVYSRSKSVIAMGAATLDTKKLFPLTNFFAFLIAPPVPNGVFSME